MKPINQEELQQVAGGDAGTMATAAGAAAITSSSAAIGSAIAGPVGAIVGAAVGAVISTGVKENLHEIGDGIMKGSDTIGKHMMEGIPTKK